MKLYRNLDPAEIMQKGDRIVIQGQLCGADAVVGQVVGHVSLVFRPVEADPWHELATDPPKKSDYDAGGGYIQATDSVGHSSFMYEHQVLSKRFTWWRRCSIPKTSYVVIDGHKIIPQPDGSLKIGCKTISSEGVDRIIKQREATRCSNTGGGAGSAGWVDS